MGRRDGAGVRIVTGTDQPPRSDEFEVTLFGPGYGESIVLHVGGGAWVIVDSCPGADRLPSALAYLKRIGLDPAQSVHLIVATHWHDDHIRGIAKLVETCGKAAFCCASALCRKEFLAVVDALERRHLTVAGSGVREIHRIFSWLKQTASEPTHAIANRRILVRNACEIWSLSPDDEAFRDFLKSVGSQVSGAGQPKQRIPTLSPNEAAVALWVDAGNFSVLLGSDLPRKGWRRILASGERPAGRASVFKVPHHGSEDAHEQEVWRRMLVPEPVAVLTPWRKGHGRLPLPRDVRRLRSCTADVYATAESRPSRLSPGRPTVKRTLRESGIELRQIPVSHGCIRLRRPLEAQGRWAIETLGSACRLTD